MTRRKRQRRKRARESRSRCNMRRQFTLSAGFDTSPLPLALSSSLFQRSMGFCFSHIYSPPKDAQISFAPPATTLNTTTITILRGDIAKFCSRGKQLPCGGFYAALKHYLRGTMALDANSLTIAKVACGGFVLGGRAGGKVNRGM